MLGFLIFIIVLAVIYSNLENSQRKQGGESLTQSPVIRIGCGCLILIIAITILVVLLKGNN